MATRDLEHDRPQPDGVLVGLDVEDTGLVVVEADQVDRRQVAGGVVEEHVLRARVRGPDPSPGRAGVPLVDRGVELETGIGAGPGRLGDLGPEVARLDRLAH